MAFTSASFVRAPIRCRKPLIFEKASSMGLRSGLRLELSFYVDLQSKLSSTHGCMRVNTFDEGYNRRPPVLTHKDSHGRVRVSEKTSSEPV
jgi:hypothetical protein